ncbi:troponin C, isoallergen Bla g 6.0101 [Anopheles cruzii]|uniref:troponin C, isoallergen Bla g 6.0101 n=1 Tax=Anopheles cruzii TaxID=68878 RepID=UPI0022EC1C80|nr:troponin C, isoallergen Bla g 6.0101 [Anopheles cruzii]
MVSTKRSGSSSSVLAALRIVSVLFLVCQLVLRSDAQAFYRRSADDLDKAQLELLRNAFNAFDQEKKGCIGTQMVGTILSMLGHQLDDKMLKEIIDEVDADGSGELEFEEFVTLAARFMVEEDAEAMQQELKEAFRLYDKEGNGYITTAVLREILKELDDNLTNEDLDMMIEEIDSDGSGTVDFDEFMEVMTGGDD